MSKTHENFLNNTTAQAIVDNTNSQSTENDAAELEIPEPNKYIKNGFDTRLIKDYPNSHKNIYMQIGDYSLIEGSSMVKVKTNHISPHGFELATIKDYSVGSIVKLNIKIPDYWSRKQRFVDYGRIDKPKEFYVIGRVVDVDKNQGQNRRKNLTIQVVNIDETDQEVLKSFISEKE